MSEYPKRKRNLAPRGLREILKSHVRFEQPPGEFKDLFRELETKGNESPTNNAKLVKRSPLPRRKIWFSLAISLQDTMQMCRYFSLLPLSKELCIRRR